MRCPKCSLRIKFKNDPDITTCSSCGLDLIPDATDILQDGMFGIAREVRPPQVSLARDVEKIVRAKDNSSLFVEGGTGVGKSFAYLIPSLLASGKRIVISTAKKALQHQLAGSSTKEGDIPFLLRKMSLRRNFALYKGSANFACWRLGEEVPKGAERRQFEGFINLARSQGKPADLSDWPGSKPYWWDKISTENCVRKNSCSDAPFCRVNPKHHDILVVNHHILSIDLRGIPGALLGPYDILVIDEAHQMPDAFRSVHTQRLYADSIKRMKNKIRNDALLQTYLDGLDTSPRTTKQLQSEYDELDQKVVALLKKATRCTDGNGIIENPYKLEPSLTELGEGAVSLRETLLHLKKWLDNHYNRGDEGGNKVLAAKAHVQRYERSLGKIVTLCAEIGAEATPPSDPFDPAGKFLTLFKDGILQAKPLMVGEMMGPALARVPKKIITSATLANGGSFEHAKSQFGIPDAVEKIYQSPFEFEKQAVLYVPTNILTPQHSGSSQRTEWIEEVSEQIFRISYGVDGNAFVLFSSRADMDEVADRIAHTMRQSGLHLVVQGDNYAHTLDEYMNNPRSVLFGLKSFWEGVDIQGDKLRAVIIPKLPFPYVGDPIMNALKKKMGNRFFPDVYVPMMLIDLKQGIGRLIRSKTDKGLLAILDPRAWTGGGQYHDSKLRQVEKALDLGSQSIKSISQGYGKKVMGDLRQVNVTNDFTTAIAFAKQLFTDVNREK